MMHQSSQSASIISDITERLTRLDEGNKQVLNFADQLRNLQDILKNPKQRGTILGAGRDGLCVQVSSPVAGEERLSGGTKHGVAATTGAKRRPDRGAIAGGDGPGNAIVLGGRDIINDNQFSIVPKAPFP